MSFSRAKIKRFNEYSGCAPPPSKYTPMMGTTRGLSLPRTPRFPSTTDYTESMGSNIGTSTNGAPTSDNPLSARQSLTSQSFVGKTNTTVKAKPSNNKRSKSCDEPNFTSRKKTPLKFENTLNKITSFDRTKNTIKENEPPKIKKHDTVHTKNNAIKKENTNVASKSDQFATAPIHHNISSTSSNLQPSQGKGDARLTKKNNTKDEVKKTEKSDVVPGSDTSEKQNNFTAGGTSKSKIPQRANSFCGKISQTSSITSTPIIASTSKQSIGSNKSLNKDILESVFSNKRRRFALMKKQLIEKQAPVVEMYNSLVELRRQINQTLGKDVPMEEFKIIQYVGQTDEVKKNERPSSAPPITRRKLNYNNTTQNQDNFIDKKNIDSSTLKDMENALKNIQSVYVQFCEDVMQSKNTILNWLSDEENVKNFPLQMTEYKKQFEDLQTTLSLITEQQNMKIKNLIDTWCALYCKMIPDNKALNAQLETALKDLKTQTNLKEETEKKLRLSEKANDTLKTAVQKKDEEIDRDKAKIKQLQEKTTNFEVKMKIYKQRIQDADAKKQLDESKIEQLHKNLKLLEEESKSKESQKMTKLKEEFAQKLQKERGTHDARLKEHKDTYKSKQDELESTIAKQKQQIETAESSYQELQQEKEKLDKKYASLKERVVQLEITKQQTADLMSRKNNHSLTSLDASPNQTQSEMDMWSELQYTRQALKHAEDKLSKKCEERIKLIQTIDKAVTEDKNLSAEGWTAKLIKKDEQINNLHQEIHKLSETIVYSQDIAEKQEKKIKKLQKRLGSISENGDNTQRSVELDSTQIQDLQDQLKQHIKKNAELEKKLQESEHTLHVSRTSIMELQNLLRVRDGIIGMLKSKKDITLDEFGTLKEYTNDIMHQYNELHTQLKSKNEQIDELYNTLANEVKKGKRLEMTVQSMTQLLKKTNSENEDMKENMKRMEKALNESQKDMTSKANQSRIRFPFF